MDRRKNDYKIEASEWYDESSSTTFQDQDRFPVSSRHSCKKHISKYYQRKSNKSTFNLFYGCMLYFMYTFAILGRRSSLERQTSMYRPTYYEEYYDNGDQFESYDNKQ